MKRMLGLGRRCGLPRRQLSQLSTEKNASAVEPEIVIPKRIPRGPTDILRALESTTHTDPTAPNYKYIDDPFLIPSSNLGTRQYAFSKESGRSAARYMLEKFPECFKNNPAEPDVPNFNPRRPAFKEGQENTEEDLVQCIEELDLREALVAYKNLETHGVEVTQETLLKLLQLVSFYNGKPPAESHLTEERYFQKFIEKQANSWEAGGIAENIFEKIQDKGAEAYSALIAGMLKHFNADRGIRLYEEMRAKSLVPSIHVYNNLLLVARRLKDDSPATLDFLTDILREMSELGVQPNLGTFNSVISSASRSTRNPEFYSKVLAEMEFLKIEPSLSTFNGVLHGVYGKKRVTHVIGEVIDRVSKKTWEAQDVWEFHFFLRAMEIVHDFDPDKELAYRLLDLADKHTHLQNNAMMLSLFFRLFFTVLCETEEIDKLMLTYHRLVPNTYSPDSSLMSNILKAIEAASAYRYLPQIWSDIVVMLHHEREELVKQVLALTAKVERGTTEESEKLQDQCVVIARDIQTRVEEYNKERERTFRVPILVDAEMISNLLQTYLNANNMKYAGDTLQYLIKNEKTTPGVPRQNILMRLAEKACETQEKAIALACAKYSNEIGYDAIMVYVREHAVAQNFGDDFLRELEGGSSASSEE